MGQIRAPREKRSPGERSRRERPRDNSRLGTEMAIVSKIIEESKEAEDAGQEKDETRAETSGGFYYRVGKCEGAKLKIED